jgi:hypothetical protein
MATPLYWQVVGAESASYNVIPFFRYWTDRAAKVRRGHIFNYFWGEDSESRYDVGFPFYWSFRRPDSETTVYGPVFQRTETANGRRRLLVLPWLFSRETDNSGYEYWGVLFRLLGYEKQLFDGERKERLWLFFALHINTV